MIALALFCSLASATLTRVVPHLAPDEHGYQKVILGPVAWSALRAHDPDFHLLDFDQMADPVVTVLEPGDQPPFEIVGDFNGDGIPDAIVMGVSNKVVKVYGLVSDADGYEVHLIRRAARGEDGINLVLTLVEDRRHRPKNENHGIKRFDHDAFHVGPVNTNPILMYWHRNRFVAFMP